MEITHAKKMYQGCENWSLQKYTDIYIYTFLLFFFFHIYVYFLPEFCLVLLVFLFIFVVIKHYPHSKLGAGTVKIFCIKSRYNIDIENTKNAP